MSAITAQALIFLVASLAKLDKLVAFFTDSIFSKKMIFTGEAFQAVSKNLASRRVILDFFEGGFV